MVAKRPTIRWIIDNFVEIIEDFKYNKIYGYVVDGKNAKRYYRLCLRYRNTGERYFRNPTRIKRSEYEDRKLFIAGTESVLAKPMEKFTEGRTFTQMQT